MPASLLLVDLGIASTGCEGSTSCLGAQCAQPTPTGTSESPPPPPPPPQESDGGTTDGAPAPPTACATPVPLSSFNLKAFGTYIEPILEGSTDYNNVVGGANQRAGCTDTTCHGNPNLHAPSLVLQPGNGNLAVIQANLAAIACFVDLQHPTQSPFLVCPQGTGTNCTYPDGTIHQHPGKAFYHDQADPNLQLVSSWVLATQGAANLWDFAYFATQIDPVFNNPTFGGTNSTVTCSDAVSCHGVQKISDAPPNRSDFPLLASAQSPQDHLDDYWSAANQLNFYFVDQNPEGAINAPISGAGSFLFLYPTEVISTPPSLAAHPYSSAQTSHIGSANFNLNDTTEVPAPGGAATAFFVSEWAAGLQPDARGNLVNWLVAGTYNLAQLGDTVAGVDETTGTPAIFDPSEGTLPAWDGFFLNDTPILKAGQAVFSGGINPQVRTVDFNQALGLNANADQTPRTAYAVLYLYNVTESDIDATVTVAVGTQEQPDPFNAGAHQANGNLAELIVGLGSGQSVSPTQTPNSTVSSDVTLPSIFASKGGPVRVMVKVLAQPGDANFQFQAQIVQKGNGQPIPPGDVYVRLDAKGGL